MEENEAQMRLAIEERELNKMAAVMKQDDKMQNLLSKTEDELKLCQEELTVEKEKVIKLEENILSEKKKTEKELEVFSGGNFKEI